MKIAYVEAIPLRIPFTTGGASSAAAWGAAGQQTVDSLIVAVTTDTGVVAAVHASAALGGPWSMVEWRYFDLEAQLYGDAIIPEGGAIAVPQGPGLGLEPRADVIRDYRVA